MRLLLARATVLSGGGVGPVAHGNLLVLTAALLTQMVLSGVALATHIRVRADVHATEGR